MEIKEILIERIKQNKNIFTQEEINDIINNNIYNKIYLLGILDGREM